MASVNQSSVWEVTSQTDDTPCDDTVMDWLHTLQRDQLEMAATILFRHLAMTILNPDRSRIVSVDFVDNPYHGPPDEDSGELCKTTPTDGTTTCHRYCTAYLVSNGKPVTLALTHVRSDEKEADAVERRPARGLGPATRQQQHPSETASATVLAAVSVQFRPRVRFTQLLLRE